MDFAIGSIHVVAPLAWPAFPLIGVAPVGGTFRRSEVDGGPFQITGDTAREISPGVEAPVGPRKVRLHDQPSGRVLAEVWSNPVTGAYAFTHIRQGLFYVTSFDHTGQYNGVISTDVAAEPMP